MNKTLIAFSVAMLLTGCVSMKRYRRDVDAAEMHGEAKILAECAIYSGANFNRSETLHLLNGAVSGIELRKLNRALEIYEYPPDLDR